MLTSVVSFSKSRQIFALVILVGLAVLSAQAQSKRQVNPTNSSRSGEERENTGKAAELFEAGQDAHQRGDFEKAVEHYTNALKYDPALWQVGLQLSSANVSLGRPVQARAAINNVLTQLAPYSDTPEGRQALSRAQIVLGEIALTETKLEEAEKAFRRAVELNAQAYRAQAGLAEVMLSRQQYAEAVVSANKAIELGDPRVATRALIAEALVKLQRYNEAHTALAEILKQEPRNSPALRQRAEIYAKQNEFDKAILDLQVVISSTTSPADTLRLAELYLQAKQYTQALTLYQQIQKQEPSNTAVQRAIAFLTVELGKGSEAITQLESLIQAEPNNALIRAQLAELYLPTDPGKALEQYAAAAKLATDNISHRIGMGTALVKLRRFQEAVPLLRGVLAENPQDEIGYFAHTNLATALFELDDYANAAREFIWILNHQQEKKRVAVTLYFLGICFDKLGDYEQALKAYTQFLELANNENQLEIDKVKLRLPSLQRQIKDGQGKRKK